ncbi:hypothetical protein [Bacillus bingmayongensis]|uniref:hypothetical protein n=1 Tax=Bacillus bingmayongensis TaxID=1150157 RepID=UPI000314BEC4|nr:hypothetical protein [Bacillus bingmayongensis]
MMEDTGSLAIFATVFVTLILIVHITSKPIQRWAGSDESQNKKTHGNGSLKKINL